MLQNTFWECSSVSLFLKRIVYYGREKLQKEVTGEIFSDNKLGKWTT